MNTQGQLILVALLFAPTLASATDYYFCDCQSGADTNCAAGNDTANGTSPATAKQSFAAANAAFNGAAAGDTINLCRGGAFTDSATRKWVNTNSSAAQRITMQDYTPSPAPTVDARPIITHTGDARPFNFSQSTTHHEGYIFKNLDLRCTNCTYSGGSSAGFFFYNDVDAVTIDNVRIDAFRIGVHVGGEQASHIIVRDCEILNNLSQGFLGGSDNGIIENNTFTNNGGFTNKDHNIYWSTSSNGIIRGNTLYKSATGAGDICSGTSLVVHTGVDPLDNLLIEDNYLYEDIDQVNGQCYGISVAPGYTNGERFTNITIRANTVENVGAVSINVTSCQDCLVENNIIIYEQSALANMAIGSATPLRTGDAIGTRNTFRNNAIYNTSPLANNTGIEVNTGTGNIIVSNAMYYAGNGSNWNCLLLGTAIDNNDMYDAIDNNICHYPNANAGEWADTHGDLAGWQNVSIFDVNSQNADPGYNSPAGPQYDLSLNATANAIDTGHATLSAPSDANGKLRDGQPDVGAYEAGTFNPPAATTLRLDAKYN